MTTRRNSMMGLCGLSRERLQLPFSVDWHDKTWDCATDGHGMLLVKGATWPEIKISPRLDITSILDDLDKPQGSARVDDLLEWSFGGLDICESCGGDGIAEDDMGVHPCGCDNGLIRVQLGAIGDGVFFNRRVLHRFLLVASVYAPAYDHHVYWTDGLSPIFVRDKANETVVVVMPYRDSYGDNGDAAVPVPVRS